MVIHTYINNIYSYNKSNMLITAVYNTNSALLLTLVSVYLIQLSHTYLASVRIPADIAPNVDSVTNNEKITSPAVPMVW